MIIDKKIAEETLKSYTPVFVKIIKQAVSEFKKDPQKLFYCSRTKACVINCLIHKYALIELSGKAGIQFKRKYGNNYIIIKDQFILKFKRLNSKLRTSNISTRQTEKFLYQRTLWNDDEIPPPVTNIFAGYTWDNSHDNYSGVFVTCPQGEHNKWYLEIDEQSLGAEVLPFQSPDTDTNKGRRAKPRKADEDESDNKQQK